MPLIEISVEPASGKISAVMQCRHAEGTTRDAFLLDDRYEAFAAALCSHMDAYRYDPAVGKLRKATLLEYQAEDRSRAQADLDLAPDVPEAQVLLELLRGVGGSFITTPDGEYIAVPHERRLQAFLIDTDGAYLYTPSSDQSNPFRLLVW